MVAKHGQRRMHMKVDRKVQRRGNLGQYPGTGNLVYVDRKRNEDIGHELAGRPVNDMLRECRRKRFDHVEHMDPSRIPHMLSLIHI